MGHSQANKAESRQRILSVASRRFREQGLESLSVADVMREAGMTVGGFYKHFTSRDELVTEALATACVEMDDSYLTRQPTLKKTIKAYLSEAHRDDQAEGCPLAALTNDMARGNDEAKKIYTDRLEKSLDILISQMPEDTEGDRRTKAMLIYSAYIGALSLSRVVPDARLSRQILRGVSKELISLFPEATCKR